MSKNKFIYDDTTELKELMNIMEKSTTEILVYTKCMIDKIIQKRFDDEVKI